MEKLKMESVNLTEQNIDRIAALFPSAITETKDANGNLKKAINFDTLKQLLSEDVVDGDECYEFTWVGKKQSIIDGNRPIRKTLRPATDESKNWDKTENLYIEGDNLEVLKLLQGSYLNAVKMIYIDPPYNTGKDFVYRDNFTANKDEYETELGLFDENENRLLINSESDGRYHSKWCSMMFPRLQLAHNLLNEEGIIFISINDKEVRNLKNICDEVFGEKNFVSCFCRKGTGGRQDSTFVAIVHEYVLCYARNKFIAGEIIQEEQNYPYFDEQKKKKYKNQLLRKWGDNSKRTDRPNLYYSILDPDGNEHFPMLSESEEGCWRWGKSKMQQAILDTDIEFKKKDDKWIAYEKIYEPSEDNPNTKLYTTWLDSINSKTGSALIKSLFEGKAFFDYPKPVDLVKLLLSIGNTDNSIILDFFSGSSTTAHAVMQLNAEDNGNRKFIMVQLPELTDEKSEAYKAGYKNICEIGKERIRRAGKKIKKEAGAFGENLDTGFRVLKLDSTNMKDVYYSSGEYNQQMLLDLESNIKDDRNDLDLLYGVLLDWGVPLSLPHTTEIIEGKRVHFVNDTDLVACFEENINESIVREIAKRKPLRVVFRDSSFANSPDKINVTEIFKTLSSETTVKVI